MSELFQGDEEEGKARIQENKGKDHEEDRKL